MSTQKRIMVEITYNEQGDATAVVAYDGMENAEAASALTIVTEYLLGDNLRCTTVQIPAILMKGKTS